MYKRTARAQAQQQRKKEIIRRAKNPASKPQQESHAKLDNLATRVQETAAEAYTRSVAKLIKRAD
jgi:hypothetical protein